MLTHPEEAQLKILLPSPCFSPQIQKTSPQTKAWARREDLLKG